MNRIRLLSEQVANQIAAGEVVERPASVVKELVENAFDAQCTRITAEIQAGGRSLIRITDDGVGMSRDDALLCLERHATSKIVRAEDLISVSTMGFRGEAIPSIASVSRMTITTMERDSDSPSGAKIVVHGGKILEVKEAGSAPGTCIEVRNLFFNLPARRKFLRSEATEKAHIQHYLTLGALAYPHVAMTFIQDGRTVWQLPAVPGDSSPAAALRQLEERLRALYGSGIKLLPLDYSAPLLPFGFAGDELREAPDDSSEAPIVLRIWGFIGAPGVSRASRDEQHLFVNRRPIENRGLNYALMEGYHTSLMKGRYPVCCLFLELDPAQVDVNIHPAKREVKFRQERAVRAVVTKAVRQALLHYHDRPHSPGTAPSSSDLSPLQPPPAPADARPAFFSNWSQKNSRQKSPSTTNRPAATESASPAPSLQAGSTPPPFTLEPPPPAAPQPAEQALHLSFQSPSPTGDPASPPPETESPPSETAPSPSTDPLLKIPLRLVGVIGKLYVVLESDHGLVLLDQHAAHERVLFEKTLQRLEQNETPSQKLLLPETIELSPRDAEFLRENLHGLTRLGVGLSEFGDRTFLLDALPPFVKAKDARRFVLELIDELKASGESINSYRLGEDVVAKTVCRHAVKANDPLSNPELINLLTDLKACQMPYTCPHGRPTMIEMNYRDLEKKFGRTA